MEYKILILIIEN